MNPQSFHSSKVQEDCEELIDEVYKEKLKEKSRAVKRVKTGDGNFSHARTRVVKFQFQNYHVLEEKRENLLPKGQFVSYHKARKELKEQLNDLLDKGFIQPSISPWGSPGWFEVGQVALIGLELVPEAIENV
ncbi:hypothetical protein MTR67_039006 [Solanum verrucosum]|uniref:Reverse transcriptase domain-containing protein n=1 Tax=Solanum verrucosum TaxID=315347 RepID=A0AAF0UHA4_SOLVR|nr:hypothetical protein MTR67_039006 [Solanum verrucosum]